MPKLHQMNDEEAVRRYLMLLLETNNRFDLLNAVHAGRLGMTDNFAAEYGFFQLRRICETMALGALTLHGDLEGVSANKFLREYHAQRIFNLLSRVHEHCFPQPVKRIEVDGGIRIEADHERGALTFQEFNTLYNRCGQLAHRGSLHSLQKAYEGTDALKGEIRDWHEKLARLLEIHLVPRRAGNSAFLFSLRAENGRPACSLFGPPSDDGTLPVRLFAIG